MKITIKILLLLTSINLFTSCVVGSAIFEGHCPDTNQVYNNNGGETDSPDAFLKSAKSSNNENNKIFLSYGVGLGMSYPITEKFSFDSGVLLSGKGNKKVFDSGSTNAESKLKLTYIDIPLLARYELGEGGFNVFGGLQPSILLSAKNKSKFNGNRETIDVKDQYKTLDVAASIGVGYNFDNGIGLSLGYDHGLTKINSSENGLDTKNRMLKLSVSYAFYK